MRTKLFILALIFLNAGILSHLFAQVNYTVNYSTNELNISTTLLDDGNNYTSVNMPELHNIDDVGDPNLSVKVVKLIWN